MKAASQNRPLIIRNPEAIRPWQHVLEPLSGYLLLGQRLLEGKTKFAGAWNFGPNDDGVIMVLDVVRSMQSHWDKIDYTIEHNNNALHEAHLLKLDCSKAGTELAWKGVWDSGKTFIETVSWYRVFYESARITTFEQLNLYVRDAQTAKMCWVR